MPEPTAAAAAEAWRQMRAKGSECINRRFRHPGRLDRPDRRIPRHIGEPLPVAEILRAPTPPAVRGTPPADAQGGPGRARPPCRRALDQHLRTRAGMNIRRRPRNRRRRSRPGIRYVLIGTIASESRSARRAIVWAEG